MIEVLYWMLVGHFTVDMGLQSGEMARGKNRNRKPDPASLPPGQVWQPTWPFWLTAHAMMHGGAVALATGMPALGLAEAACHWLIDFGKCESWYGIKTDQGLHFLCKLVWFGIYLACP